MLIELAAPCYLCGKKAAVDGLCSSCYDEQHPLMEVSTPISLLACKKCGSVKVPGGWKKISLGKLSEEELTEAQMDILMAVARQDSVLVKVVYARVPQDNGRFGDFFSGSGYLERRAVRRRSVVEEHWQA